MSVKMATDFPTEYDAIILGTGMPECIIAAALARIGHTVLHIDRNDYYSGDWATFNFKALREWIVAQNKPLQIGTGDIDVQSLLKDGEHNIPLSISSNTISNIQENIFIRRTAPPKANDETTKNKPSIQDIANKEPDDTSPNEQVGEAVNMPNAEAEQDPETGLSRTEDIPDNTESVDKPHHESTEVTDTDQPEANSSTQPDEKKKEWSLDQIEGLWRKFNIDLMPKILYCRGAMVELLISSDIAKYCEFRALTRVLTKFKDQLQQVPCSRADVFSSKQVNMIEKRMLMKLLTFCMEYDQHPEEYKDFENGLFIDFLRSKKLTPSVLHYTLHAIAMATDKTSTMEGLKSTQKFLKSLGRYGNTAFLWPLYGSGEIPQCFCRMCAVFGGVYCLRMAGHSIIVNTENKVQGIIDTEGRRLTAQWLIMEESFTSKELLPASEPQRKLSRAILLTTSSIFPDKDEHITLLSLPPPDGGSSPISVLELSPLSMACPKDFFVIQMTTDSVGNAEADLLPAIHSLFHWSEEEQSADDMKPRVLWSMFFNIVDSTGHRSDNLPENVFVLGGPNRDLDCDIAIEEAKRVFDQLCPGDEFLPKAPNPEDIIFDGVDGTPKDSGFGGQEGDSSENPENSDDSPENTKPEVDDHGDGTGNELQESNIQKDTLIEESKHSEVNQQKLEEAVPNETECSSEKLSEKICEEIVEEDASDEKP